MFGDKLRDARIKSLEDTVDLLRKDIINLQSSHADFRIGSPSLYIKPWLPSQDSRPRITIRDAILKIMDHLGLKFESTTAVPSQIILRKIGKDRK